MNNFLFAFKFSIHIHNRESNMGRKKSEKSKRGRVREKARERERATYIAHCDFFSSMFCQSHIIAPLYFEIDVQVRTHGRVDY